MRRFLFSAVNGGEIRIEYDGDVTDLLATIGELIGRLYSAYARVDPAVAGFFKYGIQQLATRPDSPAWKVRNLPEGGIEAIIPRNK